MKLRFGNRLSDEWNLLPEWVVSGESVDIFIGFFSIKTVT